MKELVLAGILLFSLPLSGCMEQEQAAEEKGETVQAGRFTVESTVGDVVSDPAFAGFGQFILPTEWGYDTDMPLAEIASLLPYHSHIDPERAVETINHMAELAETQEIFYRIYPDEVREADPEKENAGLIFFRGKPGAPFAVICPGGGFSYVGSIHEGFPRPRRKPSAARTQSAR